MILVLVGQEKNSNNVMVLCNSSVLAQKRSDLSQSWSTPKLSQCFRIKKYAEKNKIVWLVMWKTALTQAGIALYLPALPAIAISLHTDPLAIKSTITAFLLGFGISQLLYGPLSDRYGRKPLLLIGIAIFCIGCFASVFSHTISFFIISRVVQGLGIGNAMTIGRSILRDCFTGKELASAASYLSMGFAIAFGGTPLIGAYLQSYFGWQADFICLLALGVILFITALKWLPETFSPPETPSSLPQFFSKTMKIYGSTLTNILFLKFIFAGLFAYAVVIAYNVMTPFLIQNVLGYSANMYGWLAILIAIPYYLAASANRTWVLKYGKKFVFTLGIFLIISGGLIMAIMAVTMSLHLWIILLPMMIATFGQAILFPNAISGALESSTHEAGKTSAMLSSLQMLLSGVLSYIMAILPEKNQLSLALVLISLGVLSALVSSRIHLSKEEQK